MVGKTISHYRIVEELGRGGMGVVYKAEDTKLKRIVALKFLPSHVAPTPDEQVRFLQEAQAASALNHSNVCIIHDIKREGEHDFIVMEFVDGDTLRKRMNAGPLPMDEAIDIALQIGEALQEAHGKGIVHRDIKSDNIMVISRNRVKVMDFGLAKLKGSMKLTKTSSTVGTLSYMAPEQIQGGEVDHRSDIFSFGVLLYEMLSGRLPFRGEHDAAMMYSILNEVPENILNYRGSLPAEFGHVLNRALEKNPADRYQSVGDMLIDLRRLKRDSTRVLHSLPPDIHVSQSNRHIGAPTHIPSGKQRISRAAALGVAGVLVAVVAVIVMILPRGDQSSSQLSDQRRAVVAVLPFENLGLPEQEYFADGVTEEITSRLSGLSGLGVIARSSAMQYKRTTKTLRQIGEELGVGYALQGTIRWSAIPGGGSRVRINPALVRVSDATQIWSQSFEAVISDVFKVQSEIATQVAGALGVTLLQPERQALEARPTEDSEAYDFYLRGKEYFNRSYNQKDWKIAEEMLQHALDRDPNFAAAYAQLSQLQVAMYWFFYDHTEERVRKARTYAEKALALDPNLADAHGAMGYYYYHGRLEYDNALEEYEAALKLKPNNANVMIGVASVQRRQGKAEVAVRNFLKAAEIDPRDATAHFNAGQTFGLLRNYSEAERCYNRAIALAPDWVFPYTSLAQNHISWTGDVAKATAVLDEAVRHNVDTRTQDYVRAKIMVSILDGNLEGALKHLASGPPLFSEDQFSFTTRHLLTGDVYTALGEDGSARAFYDSARAVLEEEIHKHPDDARLHSAYGLALAGFGRKNDAIRSGKRGVELMPVSKEAWRGAFREYELAKIYTTTGEHERALNILDRLLSMPFDLSVHLLRLEPAWKPLKNNARFQKLVAVR